MHQCLLNPFELWVLVMVIPCVWDWEWAFCFSPMYFIPLLNEMTCSSFVSFKKKNDYCIYGCYFHINFVLCGHAHVVFVAPHKYFFNSMAHYVCLLCSFCNKHFNNVTARMLLQLCSGLKHMHSFDPPYAHNGVKPDNVLITQRKEQSHLAILMDFESAGPARKTIRSQAEALQLQVPLYRNMQRISLVM